MTLKMAERITGMTIARLKEPGWFSATGVVGQFEVRASDDKDAAEKIVGWNWREVGKIVRRRAGYRCEDCKMFRPLSCHHKTFRSHGRRDLPIDLEALCSECHGRRHNA